MLVHPPRTEQVGVEYLLDHVNPGVESVGFNVLGIAVNEFKLDASVVHQHVKRTIGLLCPHSASCRAVILFDVERMTRYIQPVIALRLRRGRDLCRVARREHHVEPMITRVGAIFPDPTCG